MARDGIHEKTEEDDEQFEDAAKLSDEVQHGIVLAPVSQSHLRVVDVALEDEMLAV